MKYQIQVENIKCGGCVNSVKSKVLKYSGIDSVDVNVEEGTIVIEAGEGFDLTGIKKGLASIGYPESGTGSQLQKARSYVSCMIGRMEKA